MDARAVHSISEGSCLSSERDGDGADLRVHGDGQGPVSRVVHVDVVDFGDSVRVGVLPGFNQSGSGESSFKLPSAAISTSVPAYS